MSYKLFSTRGPADPSQGSSVSRERMAAVSPSFLVLSPPLTRPIFVPRPLSLHRPPEQRVEMQAMRYSTRGNQLIIQATALRILVLHGNHYSSRGTGSEGLSVFAP